MRLPRKMSCPKAVKTSLALATGFLSRLQVSFPKIMLYFKDCHPLRRGCADLGLAGSFMTQATAEEIGLAVLCAVEEEGMTAAASATASGSGASEHMASPSKSWTNLQNDHDDDGVE